VERKIPAAFLFYRSKVHVPTILTFRQKIPLFIIDLNYTS